jgi:hypothetical protein
MRQRPSPQRKNTQRNTRIAPSRQGSPRVEPSYVPAKPKKKDS